MESVQSQQHWCRCVAFIVNFQQISHIFLVFLLLTLNKLMPAESYIKKSWYRELILSASLGKFVTSEYRFFFPLLFKRA